MPTLYLIPTSLNPEISQAALIAEQQQQIHHLQHFVVETAKIGRMHLKQLNLATPLQQLSVLELNKHNHDYFSLIAPLQQGHDLGLLSDCGCPAVADPGSRLVSIAHDLGYQVTPLVGPSSILLSLMASGLNGQKFSFLGYLPQAPQERQSKLKLLEKEILKTGTTFIFIEAPFRNLKLVESILTSLHPELKLCIASNLMTANQSIQTKSIAQWRNSKLNLEKQEAIFLIGN